MAEVGLGRAAGGADRPADCNVQVVVNAIAIVGAMIDIDNPTASTIARLRRSGVISLFS
jgi:hypothetical protein